MQESQRERQRTASAEAVAVSAVVLVDRSIGHLV